MDSSSDTDSSNGQKWVGNALDSLLDCTDDLVSFKDLQGNYLRCNRQFAVYAGVGKPEKIVGKRDEDLFPKSYCKLSAQQDRQVIETAERVQLDLREVTLLNKKRVFSKSKFPLRDDAGNVIGVITIFRDMTDMHQQRTRSEMRHKLVMALNLGSRDVLASDGAAFAPAMERTLGLICAALGSTRAGIYSFCGEDITGDKSHALRPAYNWPHPGRCLPEKYPGILTRLLPLLKRQPVLINVTDENVSSAMSDAMLNTGILNVLALPIFYGDKIWGMLCVESGTSGPKWDAGLIGSLEIGAEVLELIVLNYHNRRGLLHSRRKAELAWAQAERANRTKSEFLAHLTHEIRNPLNTVIGFSNILEKESEEPTQRQQLHIINDNAQSIMVLLEDVLDISRIEAGKLSLNPEPCALFDLCRKLVNNYRYSANAKGLVLKLEAEGLEQRKFMLDEKRIRQIVVNLLSNAIKYTGQGEVTLKIEAFAGKDSQTRLCLQVVDSGPGIPFEDQQRIFESFERNSKSPKMEKGEGCGLGLAICRKLADLMDAQLKLESAPGKGSVFSLVLSVIEINNPALENQDASRLPVYHGLDVIVADDEERVRSILRRFLFFMGVENVREAACGEELVRQYQQRMPDLIICDANMPGSSGDRAVAELRRIEKESFLQRSVILGISGSIVSDEPQRMLAAGCDDIALKPFDLPSLSKILHRLLPANEYAADGQGKEVEEFNGQTCRLLDAQTLDKYFRGDLLMWWKELRKSMVFEEIEDFAQEVCARAEQCQAPEIEKWGRAIEALAKVFDIKNLEISMDLYPQLCRMGDSL